MKNKIKIGIFLLLIGIFLPVFSAQAGLVPCGLNADDPSLEGRQDVPCTLCHLIVGIYGVFNWFKNILVTVAFVGIFIAGAMYVISSGDEEMMKRAKNFLSNSLIGFTIVLCAWLIVSITIWSLSANKDLGIGKTNWYTFSCTE